MMDDHWFRQIGKILKAMEVTSDATKIKLATFQLEGESQVWWDWVIKGIGGNDMGRIPRALHG